jgi:hypothetical protein
VERGTQLPYDLCMDDATILYRPVGKAELDLIQESRHTRFPPRLPHQPIFYPVLSEEYAREIAEKWNTKDEKSGHSGYVTKFRVRAKFIRQFATTQVGDVKHRELWIPAAFLEEMNHNLVGKIEVIAEFHGNPANLKSPS